MSNFASELSARFFHNSNFLRELSVLESTGAGATLSQEIVSELLPLSKGGFQKMLYCASILAQSPEEEHKVVAQIIAFNSLLLNREPETLSRCIRVLLSLGNFPGIIYAEEKFGVESESLLDLLQRRISQELNSISVVSNKVALTDYQKKVWDALKVEKIIAISAPTSAGKSFLVIEYLSRRVIESHQCIVVYIAPTRALLSEIFQKIQARFDGFIDVRVSTIPTIDSELKRKQIYVLTQERLQVLLSITDIKVDLLVVDEAQNLSDGARGMILQECIEQIVSRSINTTVVFLAPGADGFEEAASVLGLESIKPATTAVSPVLQNRIVVSRSADLDGLDLKLLSRSGAHPIGKLLSKRGFDLPKTRLAAISLELGSTGGSLVYATGPIGAETVASQIAADAGLALAAKTSPNEVLSVLAEFIEEHIHSEYKLADMVRKGVAFHYGKMPTLLREALESAFKIGALKFLTCTTTLFQGINLPARNVFVDTPTRGSGVLLDPALLWNFAGRAGRMKEDIVGNVFLVDYDAWVEKPMGEFAKFTIKPALGEILSSHCSLVISALSGNMPKENPKDDIPGQVRASAGLLIAKASQGNARAFVQRVAPDISAADSFSLIKAADSAAKEINLPAEILIANWVVDPFGQRRLYELLMRKIDSGLLAEIIPLNPHVIDRSGEFYGRIFNDILSSIRGYGGNWGGYVSRIAVPWMKGMPYPAILKTEVRSARRRYEKEMNNEAMNKRLDAAYRMKKIKPVDPSSIIKKTFEIIEDVVRFQFVQLGKVYVDILKLALENSGRADKISSIFDFSLALELGIASVAGRSFIELGLSRIAASVLEGIYPDSNMTVGQAREWLAELDPSLFNISPVIVDELDRLGLLTA